MILGTGVDGRAIVSRILPRFLVAYSLPYRACKAARRQVSGYLENKKNQITIQILIQRDVKIPRERKESYLYIYYFGHIDESSVA